MTNALWCFEVRMLTVIVEALRALTPKPSGVYIFFEQRAWPIFWIAEALVKYIQDREAYIEADKIC